MPNKQAITRTECVLGSIGLFLIGMIGAASDCAATVSRNVRTWMSSPNTCALRFVRSLVKLLPAKAGTERDELSQS